MLYVYDYDVRYKEAGGNWTEAATGFEQSPITINVDNKRGSVRRRNPTHARRGLAPRGRPVAVGGGASLAVNTRLERDKRPVVQCVAQATWRKPDDHR